MYTDALGTALFIQFVDKINRAKCIGLRAANFDMSYKIAKLESQAIANESNVQYLEAYISILEEEILVLKDKGNTLNDSS